MSSSTTTSGRSPASDSNSFRKPQAISEDASQVAELVDDLGQRPVGDPLAVGEAASDEDARLRALDELAHEPRLADPGRADDGRELRLALACGTLQRLLEERELMRTADEGRVDRAREGAHVGQQLAQAEARHRLRLPLEHKRLHRLCSHLLAHEPLRGLPEQDLACLRRLLQTRGHVDGIAGDERLARPRHDLAGVEPDPHLEAELLHRLAHPGRGPRCPERVVLVSLRDPEHGHRRVADELLDAAAVALEDRAQLGVVAAHRLAQDLRVTALAERGRADEVAEQNRDRLPDFWCSLLREACAAGAAEPRLVGVLSAALRAEPHSRRLRRMRRRA
jgi:hypothetical protein